MNAAFQVAVPMVQKLDQGWIVGRQIEGLPDEALQQIGIVGDAVENLGGGQALPLEQLAHITFGIFLTRFTGISHISTILCMPIKK